MQRIQLLMGDVWGHRKDLNQYCDVPSSVIEIIKAMKLEGKSTEDIEKEVSRKTKINPEMVGYILAKKIPA
jgi:ribosomal protein S19